MSRGRKTGGFSFRKVKLADIMNVLKPEAYVILSDKFAGLIGVEGTRVSSNMEVLEGTALNAKTEFSITTFEEKTPEPKPEVTLKKF